MLVAPQLQYGNTLITIYELKNSVLFSPSGFELSHANFREGKLNSEG